MTRRVLAATVISMVALAGLTMPASALTDEKACDLVSEDAITEYFGAPPTTTTPAGEEGVYTTCTWLLPAGDNATATAFVGIDKVSKLAKKDFKASSKSPNAEKVPGIKKGFILAASNVATVTFIKSGNFVNVQFLGSTPADAEANQDGLLSMAADLYDEL